MSLKVIKTKTSGIIKRVIVDKTSLWKGSPMKSLTEGLKRSGGRNNQGRITAKYRKGMHRQVYRNILFDRRSLAGHECVVERIEYDPNRSAFIALLKYNFENKDKYCYIIAAKDMKIGDIIQTSLDKKTDYEPGNTMPIGLIKDGVTVHCVESKIGAGALYARSAGSSAQILGFSENGQVIVRLTSGEQKLIHPKCLASIGTVSNADHSNIVLGKAGAKAWLGIRPRVRGIAMNPVDHHNGGRANGGTIFASANGLCAKGLKTRKNKRTQYTILKKRGKNG